MNDLDNMRIITEDKMMKQHIKQKIKKHKLKVIDLDTDNKMRRLKSLSKIGNVNNLKSRINKQESID